MNYLIHDADGNILRFGVCQPSDFELQASPGETVMEYEGHIDDATHYVDLETDPPAVKVIE